jgi:hypothetical protein
MGSEQKSTVASFVCAKEAADLLNCIAANEYVERKCLDRMKKLRKCTQRERVVSFNLLPDQDKQETAPLSHSSDKDCSEGISEAKDAKAEN